MFRYQVEIRARGDHVDQSSPWQIVYLGSDADEALTEAKTAAMNGNNDVRILMLKRTEQ